MTEMHLREAGGGPAATPFLRWAGSKRQVVRLLAANVPSRFTTYYEPFLGSGQLLFSIRPKRAVVGDINAELIEAYAEVGQSPAAVSARLEALPRGEDAYYQVRSLDPSGLSPLDRAARFIYLNRNSFNGVWRTNRQGHFNVPYGKKTGRLPSRDSLESASRILKRCRLLASDYRGTAARARKGAFVYMDPPYWSTHRKRHGEYGYGSFQPENEQELIDFAFELSGRGCMVLLSLGYREDLLTTFRFWQALSIRRRSSIAARPDMRGLSHELLIANYPIRNVEPVMPGCEIAHAR